MKFIFFDKSEYEKELITDLLHSENIKYVIKKEYVEIPYDCEDEESELVEYLANYNIEVFTTLEKFEFIKVLFDKKMKEKIMLEKCFRMKQKKTKKKAVKK